MKPTISGNVTIVLPENSELAAEYAEERGIEIFYPRIPRSSAAKISYISPRFSSFLYSISE